MPSPFLITGASGQLGGYLLRELNARGTRTVAWSGSTSGTLLGVPLRPVDIANHDVLENAFQDAEPQAVIHLAAISRIDQCHKDPVRAEQVNVAGTEAIVRLCARAKARLVYISTDLVFDGAKGSYCEQDPPSPVSIYGRTKLAGEQPVLDYERGVVLRVSLMFGPTLAGRPGFFDGQLRALRNSTPMGLFIDEWRTPLSLITAARCLLAIAACDVNGLLHLGGPERMSRFEMGRRLACFLGADPTLYQTTRQSDCSWPEPRPCDVSLDSARFRAAFPHQPRPNWEDALAEMGLALDRD